MKRRLLPDAGFETTTTSAGHKLLPSGARSGGYGQIQQPADEQHLRHREQRQHERKAPGVGRFPQHHDLRVVRGDAGEQEGEGAEACLGPETESCLLK